MVSHFPFFIFISKCWVGVHRYLLIPFPVSLVLLSQNQHLPVWLFSPPGCILTIFGRFYVFILTFFSHHAGLHSLLLSSSIFGLLPGSSILLPTSSMTLLCWATIIPPDWMQWWSGGENRNSTVKQERKWCHLRNDDFIKSLMDNDLSVSARLLLCSW